MESGTRLVSDILRKGYFGLRDRGCRYLSAAHKITGEAAKEIALGAIADVAMMQHDAIYAKWLAYCETYQDDPPSLEMWVWGFVKWKIRSGIRREREDHSRHVRVEDEYEDGGALYRSWQPPRQEDEVYKQQVARTIKALATMEQEAAYILLDRGTVEDIAEELGVPEAEARNVCYRGMKRLASIMGRIA